MEKLRISAMLLLFASAATIEAFRLTSLASVNNGDIWWHLSSGLWMLQHHSLPHSGLFSQSPALPWIASSWLYDLLLALAYKLLSLRSIPFLSMSFKVALALVTFLLAGGMRGCFWPAIGLSVIAQYILGAAPPGPAYFSIILFAIELLLLLRARQTGSVRPLWWLPLLLLLWANLHIQFVYGAAVLLLFVAATAVNNIVDRSKSHALALADAGKVAGLSLLATLLTPYFYRPYAVFFATTFSSANSYLPDFQALGFRQPQDYLLLLLAMAAFLTLGLRRSRDAFQIALLAGCLGLSFYSQRDAWLVALASLAVIGEALASGPECGDVKEEPKLRREALISACSAIAVLIIVFAVRVPGGRERLLATIGKSYPVAASDYIRDHRLPPPLFNAYEWGGFLTWYLPEYPVAIDGRADLYGEDLVAGYSKMMNAEFRYTEYPALANAQTILLPKKANMAVALGSVPVFEEAYSDDVAVVLRRRSAP